MRSTLTSLLLFFWLTCPSFAAEVVIVVHDSKLERIPGVPLRDGFNTVQNKPAFTVDTADLKITTSTETHGPKIPTIAKYTIAEGKVCAGGQTLFPAQEIPYQCHAGGNDLLITRINYNSLNPVYWPIALTGHPVQFDDLWVQSIDHGGTVKQTRLIKRAHNPLWRIAVFEPLPIKVQ